MPDCRMDLYEDETETDDPTLVGENCHIVAEADGGPRSDPAVPIDRRNTYSNLILLCRNHHKVVDAQEVEYSVEKLRQMKAQHEAWVREQLGLDSAKQRDDELYASFVDKWAQLAHVDNWLAWSSHVLSHGQPRLGKEVDHDLFELREWLLSRVWPGRYPDLERAFHNFRLVLQDFQETFREHADERRTDLLTRRFYKIDRWDEPLYRRLLNQFEFHVALVQDLMLELTRSGNHLCDEVRQHLMPGYRMHEGRLVVQSGPNERLAFVEAVVQYTPEQLKAVPQYPGLDEFLEQRATRDWYFGKGKRPE